MATLWRRVASVICRPWVLCISCLACVYGSECESSSDNTTPKENMSALWSYRSPVITSGAIQSDVPTIALHVCHALTYLHSLEPL